MFSHHLIVSMLEILTVAWALGYLFSRFGLPFMLGELLAGLVLGPPLLGLVSSTPALNLMADFGIFFAMFFTGIELDPRETLEHLGQSTAVAVGGMALPFAMGWGLAYLFGATTFQSLFLALGVSITAVAVQSVILKSMRINRTQAGHVLIGAAIVNDILALFGLSILLGVAESGRVDVGQLVYLLAKIGLFFGLTIMFGEFIMPKLTRHLTDEAGKGFTFAMTVALALAYLAEQAGLHLVIGAFLAGQFVRREIMDEKIYEAIADRFYGISYGFLVPIFFASLSFHLDLQWTFWFWGMAGAFLVAAVIGKVVGAALAARVVGFGWSEAKVVGVGMNGRGAVELVIGSVAVNTGARLMDAGVLDEPLLTGGQFSVLVVVAFGGAFITPLVLKSILRKVCLPEEYEAYCQLTDEIAPDGRARVKYDPKAR